jgi:hypothetical protein
MINSYREQTEDMHRASDLESEWSDESSRSDISADDVFESTEESTETNDSQRSDEDVELS